MNDADQVKWDGLTSTLEKMLRRILELEVMVEDLQIKLASHSHGYVPPPRYGG